MKILSVSDLQRTTDGVKEQQLNQTCFGNFLAPKCSRQPSGGADHELPPPLLCPGEGAPGSLEQGQDRAGWVTEGEDTCCRALRFQDGIPGEATSLLLSNSTTGAFWGYKWLHPT